jgi:hypothetical protein
MDMSRRKFIKTASGTLANSLQVAPLQVSAAGSTQTTDFTERVRVNQAKLTSLRFAHPAKIRSSATTPVTDLVH